MECVKPNESVSGCFGVGHQEEKVFQLLRMYTSHYGKEGHWNKTRWQTLSPISSYVLLRVVTSTTDGLKKMKINAVYIHIKGGLHSYKTWFLLK